MIFGRLALFLLLLTLVSCRVEQNRAPAIGEAFAGPTTLPLRQDLAPKSAVSTTAKHGDRLEVLEYKRRFVRVRTAEGKVGWTDIRQLLTPEQMADLRQMAERSAHLPSQGQASAFESLNMHSEPSRVSPSFVQIPENSKVDVVAHKLTPRVQPAPVTVPRVKVAKPRTTRRRSRERPSSNRIPPPPMPPGPKAPGNWLALSVPTAKSLEAPKPEVEKPSAPPTPVRMDDWSLVRTKDGKAGWVLTRMLSMAIPDEVAQYAEGHRITSYFALGQVHDGDLVKNNWLWTTIQKGLEPYEFDSFRVFIWSRNHHRYETAYIERNIVGHYPVHVDNSSASPHFSLLMEGIDGQLYRKTYALDGNRVHFMDRELASKSPAREAAPIEPSTPTKEDSWFAKLKYRLRRFFH